MLTRIYELLTSLKGCFRNALTFHNFILVILGFILSSESIGNSSFIRALGLNALRYDCLCHFFASTAFELHNLWQTWRTVVVKHPKVIYFNNRVVLIGDDKSRYKEGKRMPGEKKLESQSEDSGKPKNFVGFCFGCIGILLGNHYREVKCLPLHMSLHDGIRTIENWLGLDSSKTMIERTLHDAGECVKHIQRDSYLVLDAFFWSKISLLLSAKFSKDYGYKMDCIIRAKSNTKAFEPLTDEDRAAQEGKPGRPRKKGAALHPFKDLDTPETDWQTGDIEKSEGKQKVEYTSRILLWGQGEYIPVLFVLSKLDGTKKLFATTDLSLKPIEVIQLYAFRFSIESSFKWMNSLFQTFNFRFWSKAMPKFQKFLRDHQNDQLSQVIDAHERKLIVRTLRRTHVYVAISCIALGIVQMLCFEYQDLIDRKKICFLVTYSEKKVLTEEEIKRFLQIHFFRFLETEAPAPMKHLIYRHSAFHLGC